MQLRGKLFIASNCAESLGWRGNLEEFEYVQCYSVRLIRIGGAKEIAKNNETKWPSTVSVSEGHESEAEKNEA
jgi:hypothetical protein